MKDEHQHQGRRPRLQYVREYLPALAAAIAGLALSLLLGLQSHRYENERADYRFQQLAALWQSEFDALLQRYDQAGRATAAFAANSRQLTRREFTAFVHRLLESNPAGATLSWLPRIPDSQTQIVLADGRRVAVDEVGEGAQGLARFPLAYLAPNDRRPAALGRSPTGDADPRSAAVRQAVDQARPVAVHGAPLLDGPRGAQGVLIFYPVFRHADGPDLKQLAGLVALGVRPEELVAALAANRTRFNDLLIQVEDTQRAVPPRYLFRGSGGGRWMTRLEEAAPATASRELTLANLHLQVAVRPGPALKGASHGWLPWLASAGGVVITLLASAFLTAQARRSQTIEEQVAHGTRALLEAQTNMARNAEARERTLEALRESEARYRLLADNATDVISRVSPDGYIQYVSPAVRSILGYNPEDLVGRHVQEVLPDAGLAHVGRQAEEALRRPGTYTASHRVTASDGQHVWLEATHRVLADPRSGSPTEIISVSRDISSRMDAEQALRESEALFRTVFEDARVGMALFSPATGRFLRVNRAFCEMLGYSRAELEEKTVAEITHPADQHISPSEIQQVLAGEKDSFSVEKRYLHRNGTTVWILGNTSLIRSDDGEPRYFVAQIQNISARKRAEEALEQISHQRDLILNAAAEGIYGVDMDGFTTFANEAAARFLGYAVNELVGVQMHRILHHQDAHGAPLSWEDSPISACMEEQRSHHAEGEVFWTRAGAALRVHYVASPIIENGRSTGAVVVFSPMDEWHEGAARASGGGR